VRPAARREDGEAVAALLEPVLRAGETCALPRDWTREQMLDFWFASSARVFLAEIAGACAGTYHLKPNQLGGGSHVANCRYVVGELFQRRGLARRMAEHSIEQARQAGFRAMQFNCVVASNTHAIALWRSLGFAVIGTTPGGFVHPRHGETDALIMHRRL